MSGAMAAEDTIRVNQANTRNTRWGTAVTGALADDFLRIEGQGGQGNPMTVDPTAYYNSMFGGNQQQGGVLTITLVQARLAKNYGMTRMDPYCRIRVGVQVFETPTAYNGSKTPRWNKMIQCHISETLRELNLEIFDECSFSVDERVAWGKINLTEAVFNGDTVEDWYTLCGKQGDEKEGMIHVVLKYQKFEPGVMGNPMMQRPMMVAPMGAPNGMVQVVNPQMYGYTSYVPPTILTQQAPHGAVLPQQQQQIPHNGNSQQPLPETNPNDLKTLKEMCPDMDDDIIQSVLQQSGGNLDRAAEQLLEMSATG